MLKLAFLAIFASLLCIASCVSSCSNSSELLDAVRPPVPDGALLVVRLAIKRAAKPLLQHLPQEGPWMLAIAHPLHQTTAVRRDASWWRILAIASSMDGLLEQGQDSPCLHRARLSTSLRRRLHQRARLHQRPRRSTLQRHRQQHARRNLNSAPWLHAAVPLPSTSVQGKDPTARQWPPPPPAAPWFPGRPTAAAAANARPGLRNFIPTGHVPAESSDEERRPPPSGEGEA
ncbi:unnamed protein product [Urochloa humidicola]